MGGDGGSIPRRVDLVKTNGYRYARNLGGMGYSPNLQIRSTLDKLSPREVSQLRWKQCALSQNALNPPIVACRLGLLYNKEEVIKYLLSKQKMAGMEHIRSVKDVKDCKIKYDIKTSSFICPITLSVLSSNTRGVMLWPCGCVIAEKAFKQYITRETDKAKCPICNSEFKFQSHNKSNEGRLVTFGDVIVIAPDGAQETKSRLRLRSSINEKKVIKSITKSN